MSAACAPVDQAMRPDPTEGVSAWPRCETRSILLELSLPLPIRASGREATHIEEFRRDSHQSRFSSLWSCLELGFKAQPTSRMWHSEPGQFCGRRASSFTTSFTTA
eukprot:scaffold153562_cov39-Tisochrysis_lutea.AAC.2